LGFVDYYVGLNSRRTSTNSGFFIFKFVLLFFLFFKVFSSLVPENEH